MPIVHMPPVEQLVGGSDCVFAVANALHALLGDDVSEFDQVRIHRHLLQCMKSGDLVPFPTKQTLSSRQK